VGTFTREDAWLYLLAFLAWLAGFVLVISDPKVSSTTR
jgi:hypothetical protein